MSTSILAPGAVLILWSLVILGWVMVTRLPALKKIGVDMSTAVGGRGQNLEGVIPDRVNWKAHNYAHLMEQPTLFYAVILILAVAGAATPLAVALAWTYVAIRVLHSLVQATVNRIALRFPLFLLSTLVLLGLGIIALCATLNLHG
ncbi:MAG: hypothetical protein ABS87_03735 [Sphingomonas sp. SCN 67-18]|uniref:MAPEG family protein n=1 Tax=uncultured Sphingomonas sp. TaxID=158754 RepID=UPI00086F2CCA|nr:MAPEG family protein [Sphingomonas sp. SCN 67-18]ODU22147.1 MAG: hypothetical protein ABS87_03735 [Sphingomonas sp. SCN 67-18]